MKTKFIALLIAGLAACQGLEAAQMATVENRNSFVKITDAQRPDAPNREAPDILFIRKSDIMRVAVVFAGRHTEFRVFLVVYGPDTDRRVAETRTPNDLATTYTYLFPSEASATAFCEALLTK